MMRQEIIKIKLTKKKMSVRKDSSEKHFELAKKYLDIDIEKIKKLIG